MHKSDQESENTNVSHESTLNPHACQNTEESRQVGLAENITLKLFPCNLRRLNLYLSSVQTQLIFRLRDGDSPFLSYLPSPYREKLNT